MILSFVQVDDLWWLTMNDFSLTYRNVDRWSYHPSWSLTCVDSPWKISPWLLEIWIEDWTISQSRWLVVTRHGGFLRDLWKCRSMILSSVQVVDLWWLAMEYFFLTYRNEDPWSYHPSWSLTCVDSPWRISPWLLLRRIGDPIIRTNRWLVVTLHGWFLRDL